MDTPAALAAVTDFVTDAKQSGLVRRVFDQAGFADSPVAPLTQ